MAPSAGLRTVASAQKTEAGKKSTEQEVFLGVKVGDSWAGGWWVGGSMAVRVSRWVGGRVDLRCRGGWVGEWACAVKVGG